MGCDGGTIPKRDELVTLKKKPEQKDKVSELAFKWQHCRVSQEPLKKPFVACALGRLYNKDTVIERLLDRSSIPETMNHIKGLKDVKDLNLTSNPAFRDEAEKGDGQGDRLIAPYICPITGLEMNGKFKFCFFWTCGCVISERGFKQFAEKICPTCQEPFTDFDVVIMNAIDEDLGINIRHRDKRNEMKKMNKKMKTTVKSESKNETGENKVTSKKCTEKKKVESTSNNTNAKRSFSDLKDPVYKKLKMSVSKDPNASEVLKSCFTTHSDAKSQKKAHWVTFNPFYN